MRNFRTYMWAKNCGRQMRNDVRNSVNNVHLRAFDSVSKSAVDFLASK